MILLILEGNVNDLSIFLESIIYKVWDFIVRIFLTSMGASLPKTMLYWPKGTVVIITKHIVSFDQIRKLMSQIKLHGLNAPFCKFRTVYSETSLNPLESIKISQIKLKFHHQCRREVSRK